MKSSLYFGKVSHHRKSPKIHNFEYKIFMAHLFLDEIGEVFRGRWLWSINRPNLSSFKRADYHRPEIESLQEAVLHTMSDQLGEPLAGKVSSSLTYAPLAIVSIQLLFIIFGVMTSHRQSQL